ncbi:MAG: hypothetical protein JRE43_10940 [Deltaproteobacteria bacterium]|jgi:hypothetical protein|nr:hypothetical protein [Deltaproteobacteria bacterium]
MFELKGLSSDQLLAQLFELVRRGRVLEADLLEHLAEIDSRRLYLREGCPSMFAYCVEVLHFAESVAYKRIAAARAARRFPAIPEALRSGDLHLTAVSLLAPQLTEANASELLAAARHRTADEIRRLLADRRPKADVASLVKRVERNTATADAEKSEPSDESGRSAPSSDPPVNPIAAPVTSCRPPEPLGGERYLIRFTADGEFWGQIQQLKALMRHQIPDGDVGKVLAKAAAVLLAQVRARKFGEGSAPRAKRSEGAPQIEGAPQVEGGVSAGCSESAASTAVESSVSVGCVEPAGSNAASRRIPAAIRRAVARRDGERCTFVSATGRRCASRDFLEFHHREPWARRRSHEIDGITLRCRAHNQYAAERDFGAEYMKRYRARSQPEAATSVAEASLMLGDAKAMPALSNPSADL